jgi:TPR repeat protein
MSREKWERLKRRANAGDAEAQWEIGSWFQDGLADPKGIVLARRDLRAAVRWFRLSAAAGSPAGQNHLGVCLSAGRGCRRSDAEALRWFKRAFRQRDFCAAKNIASVYRERVNNGRAIFWYQRAAASGDGDAQVAVGRYYYTGVGVRRNYSRAAQCFREAIASRFITQAGREDARFHLGVALQEARRGQAD